jgi:HEAT repeat protein
MKRALLLAVLLFGPAISAAQAPSALELIRDLQDPDPKVRFSAANSLLENARRGKRPIEALSELAAALSDKEARVREAAAGAISWILPSPKLHKNDFKFLVPPLISGLSDPADMVRAYSITALCKLDSLALPALLDLLRSKDASKRRAAAVVLGRMGLYGQRHAEALLPLRVALQDSEGKVRVAAASAIASILPGNQKQADPEKLIPALVRGLKDPDPHIQDSCAAAIGTLNRAAVPTLIALLRDKDASLRLRSAGILCHLGMSGQRHPEVLLPLANALKDPDKKVRAQVAETLRWTVWPEQVKKIDGKVLIPLLVDGLKDPDIAYGCAGSLSQLDRLAVPFLIEALKGKDATKRVGAALTLMEMGRQDNRHADAVPVLMEALNDPDKKMRAAAARAIASNVRPSTAEKKEDHRALVSVLIAGLNDSDISVRDSYQAALAGLGIDSQEALLNLLQRKDSETRLRALTVLGGLVGTGHRHVEAVLPVAQMLKDPDQKVRVAASGVLHWLNQRSVLEKADLNALIPILAGGLNDASALVRYVCMNSITILDADALPKLIELAKDSVLRDGATTAIGRLALYGKDNGTAWTFLRDNLDHSNKDVRIAVAKSLHANCQLPSTIESQNRNKLAAALLHILADSAQPVRAYAAGALVALDDKALPDLIKALKSKDKLRQISVAKVLGQMADMGQAHEEAIPALRELLSGDDMDVHRWAERAIRRVQALKDAR